MRNLIEKKPKHLKPTKNITKLSKQLKKKINKKNKSNTSLSYASLQIQKNNKNTMCAKNLKYSKMETKKIKKSKATIDKFCGSIISDLNRNMTHTEIAHIDDVVLSWKFKMCVKCAMHCKGESLYDLSLSSKICHENNHEVSKRTHLLKGYGKLSAAVEYINATIKFKVNECFEAKYYAQHAILRSDVYNDSLNKCVKKLAMNLLCEIRNHRYRKSKKSVLFTLSELIFFSNKNGFVENVYNNSKQNKQDLCVDNVVKTESKITKYNKKDSKINRKKIKVKKNMKILYRHKISGNNKKSLISEKKSAMNKQNIKISFSKAKIVKPSLTFSEITKMKRNKTHLLKNFETKKFNKALVIKLDNINSNEKSIIIEGNQISNKYYGNDLSLLLGGTYKRKRNRVDYTKLNNSGFDISCSQKKSNEENHSVSRKTENLISESLSKTKTDDFKTDSNCKQIQLNSSTQRGLKLLKKVYKRRKNVIKPKNKVINGHKKHFTTQMTTVSNSISLEQKESSFISENIIQKIPINAILYKDKKIITLNEDSDWDPEKNKCSTKKKDGKVTKQKNIKNIIEK